MATVLHVQAAVLGDVLQLLAPFLGSGQVAVTSPSRARVAEVDLATAAEILGCDYFTARRLVIDQGKIPYRRKSSRPKSPILIRMTDLDSYMDRLRVEPVVKKKRGRRSGNIVTVSSILLGD